MRRLGDEYKYTTVWFCFGKERTAPRTEMGRMLHKNAYEYLDRLKTFVPPKGRCMRYHYHFILNSHSFKIHDKMEIQQSLYIVATNTKYVKYMCGAQNGEECLQAIKCGKCVDPFVSEYVGKRFWPGYYNKNNQKVI